MSLASDLRAEARWLSSGFLLMFCSGFGQTYYIALFAGHLKAELAMTDARFGALYTAGTLASAALLMWLGKAADRFQIRALGLGILAGLAATALAMAAVPSPWLLLLVLFGLRFFGQGMLTHVAMTAMGRWFNRKRGRAVSIAALGLPVGEGALPIVAVALVGLVGWRWSWVAAAVFLLFLAMPALFVLLRRERRPTAGAGSGGAGSGGAGSGAPGEGDPAEAAPAKRDWTRGEVLRSPVFYALLFGLLAPPFVGTGIFFNQVEIVAIKGWKLAWFAASFPVLAVVNVVAALVVGWLVDRFGARRLLPWFLLPLGLAALLLTFATGAWILPVVMALMGVVMGSVATLQGALWAELFGTRHLGAIRAPATAAMVLSTAVAPGLTGVLLDAGVAFENQLFAAAVYCFVAAAAMGLLLPRLHRVASE